MITGIVLDVYTHGVPELSPVAKATADNLQKAVITDTSFSTPTNERDSQVSLRKGVR